MTMIIFPDPGLLVRERFKARDSRERSTLEGRLLNGIQVRSVGTIATNEIRATLLSFRESRTPTTVLGALAARDGQSLGEIQSRLGEDSTISDETLHALETVGLVSSFEDSGITRYQIAQPSELEQ